MSAVTFRLSERGQMALPADARHRWNLSHGGDVEIVDLGDALLITPAGMGSARAMVRRAIESAGGYPELAARVAAEDPDLA